MSTKAHTPRLARLFFGGALFVIIAALMAAPMLRTTHGASAQKQGRVIVNRPPPEEPVARASPSPRVYRRTGLSSTPTLTFVLTNAVRSRR